MKKLFFLFPFLLSASEISFYNPLIKKKDNIRINVTTFSDFASTYDLFKGWKHFLYKNNKNIAYYETNFLITKKWNNFTIAFLKREEYFINSNNDTALFVYELTNKQDLISNKKYNIDIYLKGFSTNELLISNNVKNDNWLFFYTFSIVNINDFQDGWLKGYVISYENNDYEYHGESDYYYSHNYLYKLNINKPNGYGYTTHFGLKYKKKSFQFLFLTNDLFSRIYIKDSPYSHIFLNSSNKKYDKNGKISYNPSIYGIEKYEYYKMKLMKKYKLEISYENYFLGNDFFMNFNFPYIGYKTSSYKINYGFRFKEIEMNWRFKSLNFILATNQINIKKSNYFKIGVSYNYKF